MAARRGVYDSEPCDHQHQQLPGSRYVCMCMGTWVHRCMSARVYRCMCVVCMCVHVCPCVYMCLHVLMCECARACMGEVCNRRWDLSVGFVRFSPHKLHHPAPASPPRFASLPGILTRDPHPASSPGILTGIRRCQGDPTSHLEDRPAAAAAEGAAAALAGEAAEAAAAAGEVEAGAAGRRARLQQRVV